MTIACSKLYSRLTFESFHHGTRSNLIEIPADPDALTADVLVPGGVHGAAPTGGAGANEYVVGAFYTPHLTAAATGVQHFFS